MDARTGALLEEKLEFIILAHPVASIIWMIISIIQFCRTNKENIKKRKTLKKQIIISAIIIVAWIAVIIGFLILIMYSITVNGM